VDVGEAMLVALARATSKTSNFLETRTDLKSEKRWRDRLEPYHHQITNLITFCGRLPVTLRADDVGLGKTISAGLVASELISRGRVSGILIGG
jgi:hypothetical protein